ncbi:MAG: YceD family protein [Pseudomonadota bacterium]
MTQSIPDSFNVAALARARASFEGVVSTDRVPRFEALLDDGPADVQVALRFAFSPLGPAQVTGHLSATVPQSCQRCLQPTSVEVQQGFRFALLESEAEANKLPDDADWLRMDENGRVDLPQLIEDELILSLPQYPAHPEGACEGDIAAVLDGLAGDGKDEQTRRPFSGLDALLKANTPPGE